MWWDIAQDLKAEFEDWHTHEHMPERLRIPGFLRGTRCIALAGAPSYFVLYEVRNLSTLTEGAYPARLNDPTPWSRKMMPHHRNMVRSLCRMRASFGGGLGGVVATVRFSPAARRASALAGWLSGEWMQKLPSRSGLSGVHLLQSRPMTGSAPTTEQRIRGGDAQADWILVVSGYDAEAVDALARGELGSDALESRGASPGMVTGIYRVSYSRARNDP